MKRREFIKVGIGALSGLAVGELIQLSPHEAVAGPAPARGPKLGPKVPHDYSRARKTTGVCLNCSTVCGIVGYVIDGKLVKIGGNPEDPNNGKTLCAKGQSGQSIGGYRITADKAVLQWVGVPP